MKKFALLFVLAAVFCNIGLAAMDFAKLEESIKALRVYEYSKTNGVDLVWVEAQVGLASADPAVRGTRVARLTE